MDDFNIEDFGASYARTVYRYYQLNRTCNVLNYRFFDNFYITEDIYGFEGEPCDDKKARNSDSAYGFED